MPDELLPISQLISLAKEQKLYLGKGNPENRLRYFIKTGLLPHMQRRKNPASGKVEGHLPVSALLTLKKIEDLKNQGYGVEAIKGWFATDKIRQEQTSQAPVQQLNGLVAKITEPLASTLEKVVQSQQTQNQEITEALRELATRPPSPTPVPVETRPYPRVSVAVIIAVVILILASFFLISRMITEPLKNEIKSLALKLTMQPATTNNYYQTTNNYSNGGLPVDENGFLKLSGISIGDGNILLDSAGNIKFLGKVGGGLVDTEAENLLLNPGFEVNQSGKPTFWDYALVASEGNTFVYQDLLKLGLAHVGQNSAKFYFNIGSPMSLGLAQGRTTLTSGKTYTLSAWVKGDKLTDGTVRLGFGALKTTGATNYQDYHLSGIFDWKRISYTFTATSDNLYPFFEARGYSGGSLYLDDTALVEGTASTLFSTNSTSYLGNGSLTVLAGAYFYPTAGSDGGLGQDDKRFRNAYLVNADLSGTLTVDGLTTLNDNLAVSGAATVSGNVILGSNGEDTVTINGKINSDLIPAVASTYNLGSLNYSWGTLYVDNIYGSGSGTQGYWQRNSSALSPANITDDVLLGATATSSALIKLTGTSGNNSWINTGNLGIGTTSPQGKLDITSTETNGAPLVATLYKQLGQSYTINPSSDASYASYVGQDLDISTQTGNIQPIAGVYGNTTDVTVNTGPHVAAADGSVINLANYGVTDNLKALWSAGTNYGTVSGFFYGLESYVHNWSYSGGAGSIGAARAGRFRLQNAALASAGGPANMTTAQVVYANLDNEGDAAAAATIGTAAGFYYDLTNAAYGTITNSYGLYLGTPSNSGTISNHYGIYLADQTVAGTTNNFAIYSAGGTNYFAGNVGIGVTNPGSILQVAGNITPEATGTRDLGSSLLYWNNAYINNLYSPSSGVSGYWQRNSQALSPTNITDDILTGATATASALIKLTGTSGNNSWINTGKVGIGTTNPSSPLHISGNSDPANGYLYVWNTSSTNSLLSQFKVGGGVSVGSTAFEVKQNPATWDSQSIFGGAFTIQVGGATPAGANLLVSGGVPYFSPASGSNMYFNYYQGGNIIFGNGIGGEVARFQTNGKVGIGTTVPQEKLDISGNATISGNLTFYGGNRTIQSTSMSPLIIGGDTTGNITLNPLNAVSGGYVAPAVTSVSDLGTSSLYWNNAYINNLYTGSSGTSGYWQRNNNALSPTNITDDILTGATSTASALIKLTGTAGNNSWFNTGNVGIGTTNPTTLLHIAPGSGISSLLIKSTAEVWPTGTAISVQGSAGNVHFKVMGNGTADMNSTTIDNSQDTGANVLSLTTYGAGALISSTPFTVNSLGAISSTATSDALILSGVGANINFSGAGLAQIKTAASQNLAIMPGGNVGIGTTSPGNKLHVMGNLRVQAGNYFVDNGNGYYLWQDTTGAYITNTGTSNTGIKFVGRNTNDPFIFNVNTNTEALRITGGGNVGIGTTSPATKQEVNLAGTPTLATIQQNINSNAIALSSSYNAGGNYSPGMVWYTTDNNPTKPKAGIWSYIDGNGSKLYLGTSNQYATGINNTGIILDQNADTTFAGNLKITGGKTISSVNTGTTLIDIYNLATGDLNVKSGYAGANIHLYTSSGSHNAYNNDFIFTGTGSLGIGTTNPLAKLDVSGNATISGNLTFYDGRTIQTTAMTPIVIGGDTTGNITLNPVNAQLGGYVAPAATGVSDLGTSALRWNNIYANTLQIYTSMSLDGDLEMNNHNILHTGQLYFGSANPNGNVYLWYNPAGYLESSNDINTSGFLRSGGTIRMDSTGNMTNIGSISMTGSLTTPTSITSSGNIQGTIFTSTIAGGTPPLSVVSNTKVVNLNADLLDDYDWSGVGTHILPLTTSNYNLGSTDKLWNNLYVNNVIAGGTSGTQGWWQRASNSLSPTNITDDILTGATSTASALIKLTGTSGNNSWINTGNVGIGTTAPTALLDVGGTASVSALTIRGSSPGYIDQLNGNDLRFRTSVGGDGELTDRTILTNAGNIGIGTTAPAGILHVAATAPFVITSAGNVGIGTTEPLARLSVGSTSQFQVNSAGAIAAATGIDSSGNIQFSSLNAGGMVKAAVTSGRLSIATGGTDYEYPLTFSNGLTRATNAVKLGGTLTAATDIPLGGFNLSFSGTGNVGIGTTNPTYKLDVTGTFRTSSTTTFNSQTYTWPGSQTENYILQTNGSGGLSWVDPSLAGASTIYWTQGNGILYPKNSTVDVLFGGTATDSAKFAFKNVNDGTPTASISAGLNGAAYLTATGTLATTAKQNLTLGSTDTGNVIIDSGINTILGDATIQLSGTNPTISATATNSSLGLAANGSGTLTLNAGATGNIQFFSAANTLTSSGNLTIAGTTTFNSRTYTWPGSEGTNYVLSTSGSGILSWSEPGTLVGGINLWNQTEGLLSPKNSTVDMSIGGTATTSAKFVFMNVSSGNPTASISGNLSMISPAGANPATSLNALNGGTFNLRTSVGGDAGLESRLFVTNAGSVGIGTTAPSALFSVGSSSQFQVDSSGNISTAGTTGLTLTGDDAGISFSGANNHTISASSGTLRLGAVTLTGAVTGGNQNITNIGNISANSSGNTITGFGTIGTASITDFQGSTATLNGTANALTLSGAGSTIAFTAVTGVNQITTAVSRNLAIMPGGNVGIGTTAPAAKLEIVGGSTVPLRVDGSAQANSSILVVPSNVGNGIGFTGSAVVQWTNGTNAIGYIRATDAAGYLRFDTGGSNERIRIEAGGNVGIGVTAPLAKLDVNGTASVSGNLTLAGGARTIAGTSMNPLTLGDANTGNIQFFNTSSYITSTGALTLASTATLGGDLNMANNDINNIGNAYFGPGNNVSLAYNASYGLLAGNAGMNLQGSLYTGGFERLDTSGNLVLIGSITMTGTLTTPSSITSSGNVQGSIFTSTVTTGTAPMVISSQTKVSNLNVDLLDGYDWSSVGTHIIPDTTGTKDLGSSSKYWANLYVNNIYAPASGTQGYWQRNTNALSPTNITDDILTGATATVSALIKLTGTSGNNSWINTGNVGIGTTAPGSILNIVKAQNASTAVKITNTSTGIAASAGFYATNDSTQGLILRAQGSGFTTSELRIANYGTIVSEALLDGLAIGTEGAGDPLVFGTFANERMRIDGAGNVGIGTTSPISKLHVSGAVTGKALVIFDETGDQALLTASASGETKFIVDHAGNVGIGTTAPGALLAIKNAGSEAVLGSELLTDVRDRDFSGDSTNWSGTGWTIGSDVATHVAGANNFVHTLTPTSGHTYQIKATVVTTTAGTIAANIGGVSGKNVGQTVGTLTQQTWVITAVNTGSLRFVPNAAWAGTLDDITVMEITSSSPSIALQDSGGYTELQIRSGGNSNDNTLIGLNSGRSITTGNYNVFLGSYAGMSNTTGYQNVFIGESAGLRNTSGYWNTAVGEAALRDNLSGNLNTAIGGDALIVNTTGYYNTATGYEALGSNTAGYENTALGGWALEYNNVGYQNTAVGNEALYRNTSGTTNTALGYFAGHQNQTGSGNVFLGYNAGYSETGSNKLYIDNSNTSSPLIWGDFNTNVVNFNGSVGIGTTSPTALLDVAGTASVSALTIRGGSPGYIDQLNGNDLRFRSSVGGDGGLADRMILTNAGNVGIGTTVPGAKLQVTGNAYITTNLGIGAVSSGETLRVHTNSGSNQSFFTNNADSPVELWFAKDYDGSANWAGIGMEAADGSLRFTGGDSLTNPHMVILDAGLVGIGTTAPGYNLDVNGTARVQSAANPGLVLGNGTTGYLQIGDSTISKTSGAFITANTGFALPGSGYNDSQIALGTVTPTLGAANNYSIVSQGKLSLFTNGYGSEVRIDTSGNVGIGLTNPASKLDVAGTITSNGNLTFNSTPNATIDNALGNLVLTSSFWNSNSITFVDGEVDTTGDFYFGGSIYPLNDNTSYLGTSGRGWKELWVTGNSLLGGNVGIGTVAPTALLDVAGTASVSALTIRGGSPGYIDQLNGNDLAFRTSVGGNAGLTTRMTLTNAGSLGLLGTLNVTSSGYSNFLYNAAADIYAYLRPVYTSDTNNYFEIGAYDANGTTGARALALQTAGGNVGIGTTNPSNTLTVAANETGTDYDTNGQIRIRGTTNQNQILAIGYNTTSDFGWIQPSIDATAFKNLAINPGGGNVGIGTTAPAAKLAIAGNDSLDEVHIGDSVWTLNDSTNRINLGNTDGNSIIRLGQSATALGALSWVYNATENNTYLKIQSSPTTNLGLALQPDGGKVGIGTTAPDFKFHVSGGGTALGGTTANVNSLFTQTDYLSSGVFLGYDTGSTTGIIAPTGVSADLHFLTNVTGTWGRSMALRSNGRLGIGTTVPGESLEVNGRIRMDTWTADGDAAAYRDAATNDIALVTSDRRLKKDIVPLITTPNGALDIISQLNTYKYHDLDDAEADKLRVGLMAQEVLPIIPELTYSFAQDGSPETYYSVHYDKLPVLLLEAIKEQQSQINALSNQLGLNLTSVGDVQILENGQFVYDGANNYQPSFSDNLYQLQDSAGQAITNVGTFAQAVIANLRVGGLKAVQIAADTISGVQINADKIVSPLAEIETLNAKKANVGIISPLSDASDVIVKLPSDSSQSKFGQLLVQNDQGETVASVDAGGNASFSGQVSVGTLSDLGNLDVDGNASIAGTLFADEIVTKHGKFGELLAGQINTATLAATYVTNVYNNISETPNYDVTSPTASDSSSLLSFLKDWSVSDVENDIKITSDVKIIGHTSLASTTIAGGLSVDAALILDENGLQTFDPASILRLQFSGLGGVDFLAGKVTIDKDGNMNIEGNLTVKGTVTTARLATADMEATGSAKFADLLVSKKLTVATASATLTETASEQITDSSIGKATILSGNQAITIKTPQVTGASQVFVTPTTPTNNKVLYVTNQTDGQFRVEIDGSIDKDIQFNWWLVN